MPKPWIDRARLTIGVATRQASSTASRTAKATETAPTISPKFIVASALSLIELLGITVTSLRPTGSIVL
ncbi:hypothetical protein D3C81_2061410 [compost metagenome]